MCNWECKIKLSIIIPVYNKEDHLQSAIESILAQKLHTYEIILVDDGSNDICYSMCDDLSKKHSNIRVFHQSNKGVSSARNKGLSLAKGQYILFMDADDIVVENSLSSIVELMDNTCADTCIFNYSSFVSDFSGQSEVHDKDNKKLTAFAYNIEDFQDDFICLWNANIINNIGTKVYRRAILSDLSFIPFNICEDISFCLDALICSKRILYVDKVIYLYRQNVTGSLMSSYKSYYLEAVCTLLKKLNQFKLRFKDFSKLNYACMKYTNMMCKKILINETPHGVIAFHKMGSMISSKEEFKQVIAEKGSGDIKDKIYYTLIKNRLYSLIYLYYLFSKQRI